MEDTQEDGPKDTATFRDWAENGYEISRHTQYSKALEARQSKGQNCSWNLQRECSFKDIVTLSFRFSKL